MSLESIYLCVHSYIACARLTARVTVATQKCLVFRIVIYIFKIFYRKMSKTNNNIIYEIDMKFRRDRPSEYIIIIIIYECKRFRISMSSIYPGVRMFEQRKKNVMLIISAKTITNVLFTFSRELWNSTKTINKPTFVLKLIFFPQERYTM